MKTSRAWMGWVLLAACTLPGAASVPAQSSLDRLVAARRAVEEVYWRHRTWPDANAGAKPALDTVLSAADVREKVTDALRKSAALEKFWRRPITSDQLQAEIDRMAAGTKSPGILRELFAALGNDPALVAETLARPNLADRLIRSAYAGDDRMRVGGGPSEVPFDEWWASVRDSLPATVDATTGAYRLPEVALTAACHDEWFDVHRELPAARVAHTTVWTGSEMIVWGGSGVSTDVATGDRYNPATDTWSRVRSDATAPSNRGGHVAVWTGTEMIVWGGGDYGDLNTGGRYNPSTDTWSPTRADATAPAGRLRGTAVWTGTEMIVWGGYSAPHSSARTDRSDGGRYDPVSDTWSPTRNDVSTPAARSFHRAVWTGTEMIVWGGASGVDLILDHPEITFNTGGRYDPASDTWTPTPIDASTPSARKDHAAVWTGSEMIAWGGAERLAGSGDRYFDDGARYDPAANRWTGMSSFNAPTRRARAVHAWTGAEMIVFAGVPAGLGSTDKRYNPASDTWSTMANYPSAFGPKPDQGLWTGSELIVWGGSRRNLGGRYSPASDSWIPTAHDDTPSIRYFHTAVWTGAEMIVWGGRDLLLGNLFNDGSRYDPATDSWTRTRLDATTPSARAFHTAVWTGSEMIVWGGAPGTGGRYSPVSDTWTPMATSPFGGHAIWTGSRMIVWNGAGGLYDPASDSWVPMADANAPSGAGDSTAVWTGSEMIVWGGQVGDGTALNSGGRYNPSTDSWVATSITSATPFARTQHSAVWTGSEMIVWGGAYELVPVPGISNDGGAYDPRTDSWRPTSLLLAPPPRNDHSAVWTGREMIIWGGVGYAGLSSGGRYDPYLDSWLPTRDDATTPPGRQDHSTVWTGSRMIVWGATFSPHTGGAYCPPPGSPVISACVTTSSPIGKGSGTISWRTWSEIDLVAFNVVTLDGKGNRSQVNAVPIPCTQCVTGLGDAYVFIVPKHKSASNFFIESVRDGGVVDLFPATKGCAP